ncbi:MAG: MFS transporter [Pedosphaera sp.]|nr:MFS transporter [Pedosphaera sp.]
MQTNKPGSGQDPASSSQQPGSVPWGIVGMLMALCFISHLNRISMSVAGDERIMKQFSISPEKMGLIYSSFLFVYTVFMIPGGFFIDRFGARVALMVVGFGSALFAALTGLVGFGIVGAAQVWLSLMLVRGAMGFLTTPLHPGCARAVSFCTPLPRCALINGLVNGAALLGIACTYKVFGTLIDSYGWPNAFVICGVATAVMTAVWAFYTDNPLLRRPTTVTHKEGTKSSDWTTLLKSRSLVLLTLGYAAVGYFQYLFFYWMHYYFDEVLHLGKSASQFYAGIPPLAMAVGMPLGGWLSDHLHGRFGYRKGRSLVPILSMVGGAIFLCFGILSKSPAWIVAWFSLALGVVGACEGSFWSTAVELGGRRGGTAAAILNTGGNGGGLLAPVVTPWVSGHFGWQVGIGLGGLICLLGALCWLGIDPAERTDESERTQG